MLRELSSHDVAALLGKIGIHFKRHGKEDIYEGVFRGKVRVVIVPRNKRSIPRGTLASILRQAGLTREEAEKLLRGEEL
ncbi:MAG: type II toxin-antitoxin system HicA family toxin [Candidatus Bipolaricaulota bacterium]|nr:type II toxin-antitoxin system HicA family toxin [Candidatus Bipolaricaulota bacterium]